MSLRVRAVAVAAVSGILLVLAAILSPTAAQAHGFSSTVYVHVSPGEPGHVRTLLELEYDLLVVSTADYEDDDPLFHAGTDAFNGRDPAAEAAALAAHKASLLGYVTQRFAVSADGAACTAAQVGDVTIGEREGVPYADLLLDWDCPQRTGAHEVRTSLFGDAEGYVTGTKTIVTYDIDGHSGSAALDAEHPSFSTGQAWYERFWEFFRLGAEHLLTGIDHILFLLALIAGSRKLREIVLAATSFTLAHSVTFILAALGVVHASGRVVEPIIAASISFVAAWPLWRAWQRRRAGQPPVDELALPGHSHFSLDRSGWLRLGVVFCFGLVHGLGFASALGIDEAWSWTLLWSLLVFNVGIEVVQLTIIAIAFPLLMLLRHRAPRVSAWATVALSAAVSLTGLFWFVQRLVEG